MTQEAIALRTSGDAYPGLAVVQDINKALATIATDFAGSADPAALVGPYMKWVSDSGWEYRRNATNTGWVLIGPAFHRNLAQYQAADIPTQDDGDIWVEGIGGYRWNGTAYVKTNFDRNNIVGTVSQSGGTPTGSIIESGSNANGYYAKWADGTMICTGSASSSLTTSTAVGSLYQSSSAASFTFPAAFSAIPTVMSDSVFTGGSARAWCFLDTATASGCSIIAAGPTSTAVALPKYIAMGRWF